MVELDHTEVHLERHVLVAELVVLLRFALVDVYLPLRFQHLDGPPKTSGRTVEVDVAGRSLGGMGI